MPRKHLLHSDTPGEGKIKKLRRPGASFLSPIFEGVPSIVQGKPQDSGLRGLRIPDILSILPNHPFRQATTCEGSI